MSKLYSTLPTAKNVLFLENSPQLFNAVKDHGYNLCLKFVDRFIMKGVDYQKIINNY